ncbi:MAG: hypothetical protein SAK29_09150 [Scytonema sp. PMC 1069.18]|nr:hypothetical protein [Scytonema sp. PMC 1069.18]MEC4879789.1 hypothetical protein [Scytonema sp. PMC 1070.18]
MLHSQTETEAFIDECQYAFHYLYLALGKQNQSLEKISEQIKNLEKEIEGERFKFIEHDQWEPSPRVNYLYKLHVEHMDILTKEREKLSADLADFKRISERRQQLSDKLKATEESMAALGGAVLQIAKQVISYRFGKLGHDFHKVDSVREIGTQSIVEIIWRGRNHALHWEEPEEKQIKATKKTLSLLKSERNVNIQPNRNNSLKIIEALGWRTADDVLTDLRQIIAKEGLKNETVEGKAVASGSERLHPHRKEEEFY